MTTATSQTPRERTTSATSMPPRERATARLDRLEDEKRQMLRALTELKAELDALRAHHITGSCILVPAPPELPAPVPLATRAAPKRPRQGTTHPAPAVEAPPSQPRSSRRGLLRAALGAATVGSGALLQTQTGAALAETPNGTMGQTTFRSATSTPTVTIKNTGTGLALSTASGASLGATTVVSLSASGAVSAQSADVGAAMTGTNNSTVANAIAVSGVISSSAPGGSSAAVRGQNNGTSGAGIGVWGSQAGSGWGVLGSSASGGIGVYGADGGNGRGGSFESSGGTAVYALDTGSGLAGYFSSTSGSTGVVVTTVSSSGSTALSASGDPSAGIGVNATGGIAVAGTSSTAFGTGVYGTGTYGVYGYASGFPSGTGVLGIGDPAASGAGLSGDGYYGVFGYSDAGSAGVTAGYGVYGAGDSAYTSGWAGYFAGDVYGDQDLYVNRNIYKAGGSFLIDHPLDPANKYLIHSFVESSERLNVYSGVATLGADGTAQVTLPDWFGALNRDYRYQVTAMDSAAPGLHIAQRITETQNAFTIAGGAPGQQVSWQVSGVRQDAWASANPLAVEKDKVGDERGTYLHPELFGASAEQVIPRMAPAPPPARPQPRAPCKPAPVSGNHS